jgi:cyanophycin synthetase
MITLYDDGLDLPLLWTHLIPATMEGKALHNVQNAMAAALMAYAMDTKVDNIRQGLRTFDTSFFQVPGRMNVYDEHPFKVILDYGHNPAAVLAMVNLVVRLDVEGKRICVVSAPGDRRDEDIRDIARNIAAGNFNEIILRRDDSRRGRGDLEVPKILEDELLMNGVDAQAIRIIVDEQEAVDAALNSAKRGDLVLIFGDATTRCWKQIVSFAPESSAGAPAEEADSGISPLLAELSSPQLMTLSALEGLVIDERGARLAAEDSD